MMLSEADQKFMQRARELANSGDSADADREPVHGALLVKDGSVISEGTSCRYSRQDPVRYAEMDCIANAGRRADHAELTLYTTASPNWLTVGTMVQFGIGGLVFDGATGTPALEFLSGKGVVIRRVESQAGGR